MHAMLLAAEAVRDIPMIRSSLAVYGFAALHVLLSAAAATGDAAGSVALAESP